jgi:multisubunit Na+/H+ antiporter MnhE subunit
VKHTGEPRGPVALPFDQEARRPSLVVALFLVTALLGLPLLYLLYVAFTAAPVLAGIVVGTVILMLLCAFLGSRLYYAT